MPVKAKKKAVGKKKTAAKKVSAKKIAVKKSVVSSTKLKGDLKAAQKNIKDAKKLIDIISRGKYQWQATFDAIQDPVMIINKKFRIVRANMGFARAAGQDIKSIIGKKCHEIFAGRKTKCLGCPVDTAFLGDEACSNRLADHIKRRDYIANAFPFKDEVDKSDAVVVHYRDITEEKRLQQELMQQEKMAAIGMLAGGVAHEINNPLGGIIAFTQLIKRDLKEGDQLLGDMEEIENAAQRCKKIVQDLLDFSRASSDKQKHWLDVNPLIEKVTPFLKMELRSLNITLETDFQHDISRVYGDANRLQQVFLNLLTNACQSMKHGGELGVKTYLSRNGKAICVEISDTGCGISEEDRKKIFDPFYTTKRPGEGTGLGLSISYKIIRDHGGNIDVRGEEGKGATFIVSLPVVREGEEDGGSL